MGNAGGILAYVRVTGPQAKLLEFIGERGGEISWDWSACRPDVATMVRELIDDKRLLAYLPAQGRLRMTDPGREALSQIQQSVQRAQRISS